MQHIFFATEKNNMTNQADKIFHYTDSIHYELEQTAKLMRKLTLQLFEKLNIEISLDECAALDTISCHENICQRDLAKLIIKDRANTGRILNSLEEKGFINRVLDMKNNRLVKKLQITSKGRAFLAEIVNKIKSHMDNVAPAISKEEILKVKNKLQSFRLNLENVVEMKI